MILDTAGRLHVDDAMMDELVRISGAVTPSETLLVVDAMTGQESVRVAEAFHAKLPVTGLVLTKMDGDARGGAALSIRAATGLPIAFLGTGERTDGLEPFHPDRLAQRILGHGRHRQLRRARPGDRRPGRGRARRAAAHGEPLHAGGLPQPAGPDQEDGADRPAGRHDARGRPDGGRRAGGGRLRPDGADRGDHRLDDARRAAPARDHQGQPATAHRARQRHLDRRGESAAQAVRRDAEDDEDDVAAARCRSSAAASARCSVAETDAPTRHRPRHPAGPCRRVRRRRLPAPLLGPATDRAAALAPATRPPTSTSTCSRRPASR